MQRLLFVPIFLWNVLVISIRIISSSFCIPRYTKLSATIASTAELEILVRNFYFEEMMKSLKDISSKPDSVLCELNDCFKIVSATLLPSERGVYITDNKVECCLTIESYFPREVNCKKAAISIENREEKCTDKRTPVKNKTDLSSVSSNSPKKGASDVSNDESIVLTRLVQHYIATFIYCLT